MLFQLGLVLASSFKLIRLTRYVLYLFITNYYKLHFEITNGKLVLQFIVIFFYESASQYFKCKIKYKLYFSVKLKLKIQLKNNSNKGNNWGFAFIISS